MVIFPNAKINIGLNITHKRTDGYHDLETVFYPINIKDCLEVVHATENETKPVLFSTSGINVDGDPSNNLCYKAYYLLKKDYPQIGPIQLFLHKVIPIGAGLGGGSSDGAHMLTLLDQVFDLQIKKEQLLLYALELGSDCPFFIYNQACFASGKGEKLTPISLPLSSYKIFIVNPNIHINTGWAFQQLSSFTSQHLKQSIMQPISEWKKNIFNDFETPVFLAYPEIKKIKDLLYENGAIYASMSGTGSTVFGIFENEISITNTFPKSYFHKWV